MKTPAFLIRLSLLLPMLALLPQTHAKTFPAGADHFADAPQIDVRSGMSEPTEITSFSREAGEENLPLWPEEGTTAWWSWTAPASGFCKVEAFTPMGFEANGSVHVLVGDTINELRPPALRSGTHSNRIRARNYIEGMGFQAVKGETYRLLVNVNISPIPYGIRLRLIMTPSKRVHTGLWRLADSEGKTVDLGQVTLTVADNSRFTGKITMLTGSRGFIGRFDEAGLATVTLKRLAPGAGETKLLLDVSGSGAFSLERDGLTAAGKLAERALFTTYFPYHHDRPYACIYANAESDKTGAGRLFMEVTKRGAVRGVGMGLDGQAFTFAASLVSSEAESEFEVPVHARIRGRKGAALITVKQFTSRSYPDLDVEGHFFRAPDPAAVFYPEGIDLGVEGHGSMAATQSHSPLYRGFLIDSYGAGFLVVSDSQAGFAQEPVQAAVTLTGDGRGRFLFASHPLKPVLKGIWMEAMAKGSIADQTGKRWPVTLTLTHDTARERMRLTGLVRGRTRTYRVEVRPPDVAP